MTNTKKTKKYKVMFAYVVGKKLRLIKTYGKKTRLLLAAPSVTHNKWENNG